MLLGIVSDTHDQLARTQRAVELFCAAGAEALVHCGDVTGSPIIVACSRLPCWFVLGNNDVDAAPELKLAAAESGAVCLGWGGFFEFGGKRFGVTHGHLSAEFRRALSQNPDYLLTGHTHVADAWWDGTVRRINPGALHSASMYSVALLDTATGELQFVEVAP